MALEQSSTAGDRTDRVRSEAELTVRPIIVNIWKYFYILPYIREYIPSIKILIAINGKIGNNFSIYCNCSPFSMENKPKFIPDSNLRLMDQVGRSRYAADMSKEISDCNL